MWPPPSVFPGFLKTNTKDFYVQKQTNKKRTIWSRSDRYTKTCSQPPPQPPSSPTLSSKPIHAILVLLLTSGPTPSALMSRASASHCDFCLPSFILDLAVTAAAETRRVMWWPWQGGDAMKCQGGESMPCTRCTWVTGRHIWKVVTIQHTMKEIQDRTARWGENECLRDIRGFLRTFCVWIFVYCRRIN